MDLSQLVEGGGDQMVIERSDYGFAVPTAASLILSLK
jgi:hypothetical protein